MGKLDHLERIDFSFVATGFKPVRNGIGYKGIIHRKVSIKIIISSEDTSTEYKAELQLDLKFAHKKYNYRFQTRHPQYSRQAALADILATSEENIRTMLLCEDGLKSAISDGMAYIAKTELVPDV